MVMVTTTDDLYQGDHISWMVTTSDTDTRQQQGWRYGIITMMDRNTSLEIVRFKSFDFTDHLVNLVVIDRSHSKIESLILLYECYTFARWCKLGNSRDSDSVDRTIHSTDATTD